MHRWIIIKRKLNNFKFLLIFIIFIIFSIISINSNGGKNRIQYLSDQQLNGLKRFRHSAYEQILKVASFSEKSSNDFPLLTHHPFDNKCQFPIPNIYAKDIYNEALAERRRRIQCNLTNPEYATMDSEGFMYVHPHFVYHPNIERNVKCKVVIIEGGLRMPEKKMGKNQYKEIKSVEAPELSRFWVNANSFIIKCFNLKQNDTIIWEKPFPGIIDDSIPLNQIVISKDLTSFGNYGNKLKQTTNIPEIQKYSIDILGFDSTGRTVFMRHLPRTVETMHKLGYHFFYGYNKVADNSIVNLTPILIGNIEESINEPKNDASGDINIDTVIPHNKSLDPTNLNFLWKIMEKKWGCKSMFNEDISRANYGLFNYPLDKFQAGFRENPADNYYRAYYLAIYKKWPYKSCKNGEQIQKEFVDLWRKFAHKFKNICHFGFSFITTLTHEDPSVLEVLDEKLNSDLSILHLNGALDNTLSIIMADHGNRIGAIKWRYTGTIEERMPLMAIRLPTGFSQKYPEEYQNFIKNQYKLIGNYDIHETLFDIATMRFGKNRENVERPNKKGKSLFEEISNNRTCYELFIPENFCTCMVDVSNVTNPLRGKTKKNENDQKKTCLQQLKNWIESENLNNCIQTDSLQISNDNFQTMAINQFARYGLRTKANITINQQILSSQPKLNFVNYEFNVNGKYQNDEILELRVRTEYFYEKDLMELVFEPFVIKSPNLCNYVSLFDVCQCFNNF